MSLPPPLKRLATGARRRDALVTLGFGLPALAALVALAARLVPPSVAITIAFAVAAMLAYVVARRWARRDDAWAARRLDAGYRRFEDSADLLLREPRSLAPLARLQRERMLRRFDGDKSMLLDLRERWPLRALLLAWLISAAVAALAVLWPGTRQVDGTSPAAARPAGATAATRLLEARLAIRAPAYTGVPERTATELDARVEEGAEVAWSLKLDARPTSVTLRFHDGSRLALAAEGDASSWRGTREIASPLLYRIELEGAPPFAGAGSHKVEVVPDRAPEVRVLEPDRTLTLLDGRQTHWTLAFEASDDYGIGATRLELTLAQGTGENVTFKSRTIELQGEGEPRLMRYRHVLDLKALGIAAGDDVIVRLRISDRRAPEPNTTRSASFILRWPPEVGSEGSGVEGVVERALPAYFRSQRQIIIDTEALAAERPKLRDEAFAQRANGIAEDQKVLRLRYGQFLGEESEEVEEPGEAGHAHEEGGAGQAASIGAKADSAFGQLGDTEAQFGHVHDIAEAATLLDTETRETLRRALSAMWQAERQLRQAALAQALPAENQALKYIKQVQQSARIYLARLGLELPAIDETRRLTGDRRGVTVPADPLVARSSVDVVPAALWRSLHDGDAPDFAVLRSWISTYERELPDALGLLAALERLEADPACADCAKQLERLAWPLLRAPAAGTRARDARGDPGRAYLDALREPGS